MGSVDTGTVSSKRDAHAAKAPDAPAAVCALGGHSCAETACCSGSCHDEVCVCTEATGNCQTGSDCCSGVCANGVCASCNGLNESCTESANCCGGSCIDGVCACVPTGNPCTTFDQPGATDCCVGGCYLDDGGAPSCQACVPLGSACSASNGCCAGAECLSAGDGGPSYCYASVGSPCGPNGLREQCSSGTCTDGTCACATSGAACFLSSDCCASSDAGETGKCVDGVCGSCEADGYDACTSAADCCGGYCIESTCASSACLSIGAFCESAADCCSGNCDIDTNQCASL